MSSPFGATATNVTSELIPLTGVGVVTGVVDTVPFPIWPKLSSPQHVRAPPSIAQVLLRPVETCVGAADAAAPRALRTHAASSTLYNTTLSCGRTTPPHHHPRTAHPRRMRSTGQHEKVRLRVGDPHTAATRRSLSCRCSRGNAGLRAALRCSREPGLR